MRVAHIAFMYGQKGVGGACIAATRLHKALLARGVESHYLCWSAAEAGVNVHVLPRRGIGRAIYYLLTRLTHYVASRMFVKQATPINLFDVPGLSETLRSIRPDVVHLQWMNEDFPSFAQVEAMEYPLVINLHDFFAINAIDAYPCGDVRFQEGFTKLNSTFLERWLWWRKTKMFRDKHLCFTGPSEWIGRECGKSIIGAEVDFVPIPNIIDPRFFEAGKLPRKGNKRFVVIFGAHGGRSNPLKGFSELVAALRLLPEAIRTQMELRIFGEDAEDCIIEGVRVRFLGTVSDVSTLASYYGAADVCALPSIMDNAPQTKFEALACGIPVVAFDRAGCSEWIEHGENGWIAGSDDIGDYAKGLEFYFHKWKTRGNAADNAEIALRARKTFCETEIVDKYLRMYAVMADGVKR